MADNEVRHDGKAAPKLEKIVGGTQRSTSGVAAPDLAQKGAKAPIAATPDNVPQTGTPMSVTKPD